MEGLMTSRFRWHASRCDERLYVLLATRRASWNGRQKPEATFLVAFGTPSSSLIKLFTRLGEISVCSLWMYIRRLGRPYEGFGWPYEACKRRFLLASQMISACCLDDWIMLKMKSECALGSDSSLLIGNPSIMLMPDKCIYKKARGLCRE